MTHLKYVSLSLDKVEVQSVIKFHIVAAVVVPVVHLHVCLVRNLHLRLQGLDPLSELVHGAVDLQAVF